MIYIILFSSFLLPVLFENFSPNPGVCSRQMVRAHMQLLKLVFLYSFFAFFLVCALRYKTGYDWLPYELYYEDFPKRLLDDKCEPLFIALYGVFKFFSLNFYVMQFCVSLFCSVAVFRCYRQLSPYPAFSLFLYCCFYYHILQMGFVRQEIAVAFSLLAIMQMSKENKKASFILTLAGTLFHYSSFLLFFMFFFNCKSMNKRKMLVWLVLAYIVFGNWFCLRYIFLLLAKIPFVPGKIMRMIELYFSLSNMTAEAGFYGLGWLSRRLVLWAAIFLGKPKDRKEILVYKLTFTGLIFESFGFSVIVLGRLSYVFLCFEFICIAYFVRDFFRNKENLYFKPFLFSFLILFYSVQGPINFIFLRTDDEAMRYKPYYSILYKPVYSARIEKQIHKFYETHGR